MAKNFIKSCLFTLCILCFTQNAFAFELPKISNPFAAPIAAEDEGKPTDIVYNELKDIPIPSPMLLDTRNSSVITVAGEQIGIEFYTGRLEIESLNETMKTNMKNHGWNNIASLNDPKYLQIYKKGSLLAIISISKQTINTALEVVVVKTESSYFSDSMNEMGTDIMNVVDSYTEELKN